MENDNSDAPELPTHILYTVVISRFIYSSLAALGVFYVVLQLLDIFQLLTIPFFPTKIEAAPTLGLWFVIFLVISFIIVGLGIKVWILLSWGTAYIFSSKARAMIHDEFEKIDETS